MKAKRRFIVWGVVLVLAIAYVLRVVTLNLNFPNATVVQVPQGETVVVNELEHQIQAVKFLTTNELQAAYI